MNILINLLISFFVGILVLLMGINFEQEKIKFFAIWLAIALPLSLIVRVVTHHKHQ